MGAVGFEPTAEASGKSGFGSRGGADCGALGQDPGLPQPVAVPADLVDLAAVVATWPKLPEPIRRAIMALVGCGTGITTTETSTDSACNGGFGDGDTESERRSPDGTRHTKRRSGRALHTTDAGPMAEGL